MNNSMKGLIGTTTQSLKRTHHCEMARENQDMKNEQLMNITGHKSVKNLEIYLGPDIVAERKKKLMDGVQEKIQ